MSRLRRGESSGFFFFFSLILLGRHGARGGFYDGMHPILVCLVTTVLHSLFTISQSFTDGRYIGTRDPPCAQLGMNL